MSGLRNNLTPGDVVSGLEPSELVEIQRRRWLTGTTVRSSRTAIHVFIQRFFERAWTACGGTIRKDDHFPLPAEAAAQAGPKLRIIQDPISRLTPEMLYRQVQFLIEESDWAGHGEEVDHSGGPK